MSVFLYKPDQVFKSFLNLPNVNEIYSLDGLSNTDTIYFGKYLHTDAIVSLIHQDYSRALENNNFVHQPEYILNKEILDFLKIKNTRLVLYNEYETEDLIYNFEKVYTFITKFLGINLNQVVFSTSDYLNHLKSYQNNIIGYDWVFLRELRDFDVKNIVNFDAPKKHRILSLNRRPNLERYLYCAHLFTHYKHVSLFSYLAEGYQKVEQYMFSESQMQRFNETLPSIIDDIDPNWSVVDSIYSTIQNSYFMVIFETNTQSTTSNVEQVSEKSYKGIKTGKPFLIFTSKGGILSHLQNLGFKTFSPMINESYDNPKLSYFERFDLLLKESNRICEMEQSKIDLLYDSLRSIIEHNIEVLKSKTNIPNIFEIIN